jgi:uncharacterized protein (DUF1778 family)
MRPSLPVGYPFGSWLEMDGAVHEAEGVLADRCWFVIDGDALDAFDRQLDEAVPCENDLRDLLRTPTIFDQQ